MMISQFPGNKRKSIKSIVTIWCFISLALLLTSCNQSNPPPSNRNRTPSPGLSPALIQCSAHSSIPINLTIDYGSEKQKWMEDVVKDFNSRGISACDGPIHVTALPLGSGESMQKILHGDQPDIWSPAGRAWLSLLNAEWRKAPEHNSDLVIATSIDSPSLVISPVVIAMWKSQAQALGWPHKHLGWSDIAALSMAPQGWAAYGHPEWGKFQFAHTQPNSSNSGLDAVIAEYYAALGKQSELSSADVDDAQAQNFVAGIERSIIYYGESTGFFAEEMCKKGSGYLSAAVLYESLVVEMNEGKLSSACPEPAVAIYPKEGTFYSDHPFAILQAPWVTEAKRTSALAFRNFLFASTQQKKALLYGFRPADPNIQVTTPLDSQHGVDSAQPNTTLQIPSVNVVQKILAVWGQLRHRVGVMLMLDTSGSMNYVVDGIPKINAAKKGLKQFIGLLSDSDWVGFTTFSTEMHVLSQVSPLGSKRQELLNEVDRVSAEGDTRLYDSIADQVDALNALPSRYIKAIVVLTDGMDTIHPLLLPQLLNKIKPSKGNEVRIFTIAYGDQSYIDVNGLRQIAEATGGREYAGTTQQDIQQVYEQVSQFFTNSD